MNRRPRISVIAFGQAPAGLIYELEKRGVDVTKGEVADVEELVESQDPHLIALSGIRGAMELSTLLEDQDRASSPRVAVIAARRDLSRLWGLNRDVVISLLATEMGDKVVAGRLDALARQAAKKRGEVLEPIAGASVSLEPRLPSDALTTMAPQAVAAIQLVKQGQKVERAEAPVPPGSSAASPAAPAGPKEAPAAAAPSMPQVTLPSDVTELDSDLLESDRPPAPEKSLPSMAHTRIGLGLPENLRLSAKQAAPKLQAPPEPELGKSEAPTDPPPASASPADASWDLEITSQYESVTARPPEAVEKNASDEKSESAPSKESEEKDKSDPLSDVPLEGPTSEPFALAESSPGAAAVEIKPEESPETALEKLEADATEGSSDDERKEKPESESTPHGSISVAPLETDAPFFDSIEPEAKTPEKTLADILPEKRSAPEPRLSPEPRTSLTPSGKKSSPAAGLFLVLLGGLGAAYLISSASGPSSAPAPTAEKAPLTEQQDEPATNADAPSAEPADAPSAEPAAEAPAAPTEEASGADENAPALGSPSEDPKPAEPAPAPSTASAKDLAAALTVTARKTQTCEDLVPNPPPIGRDPAAQASPSWNAARKAIVKGDLVAAKTGMCEAALINTSSPALEALALLYVTEDAPTEALIWLDKAEAVRPGVRETLDLRAVALTQLGRIDEAREVWFRALHLTADETGRRQGNAIEDINVGKQHLKRGDIPRAERLLRRALVLAPDHPLALSTMAEVLLKKKEYRKAAFLAETAIARESYLPDAYVTLAEIAQAEGDIPRARKELERALKVRPDLWAAKKLLQDLDKAGK